MSNETTSLSLEMLRRMMASHDVKHSGEGAGGQRQLKKQPYLGGNLDILNPLPMGEVREETTPKGRAGLKAPLPVSWLRGDGTLTEAKNTQVILYPQYPEIRLSGFLKGTRSGPNALMTVRQAGRLLFLGITTDRRIIGWVTAPDSALAAELRELGDLPRTGVFQHVPMGTADTSRDRLLQKLREIHLMGWLASERLYGDGRIAHAPEAIVAATRLKRIVASSRTAAPSPISRAGKSRATPCRISRLIRAGL